MIDVFSQIYAFKYLFYVFLANNLCFLSIIAYIYNVEIRVNY